MRALLLLAVGCASLAVKPEAAAQRQREAALLHCLRLWCFAHGEPGDQERMRWCMAAARVDCVGAGLNRDCAEDWTNPQFTDLECQ